MYDKIQLFHWVFFHNIIHNNITNYSRIHTLVCIHTNVYQCLHVCRNILGLLHQQHHKRKISGGNLKTGNPSIGPSKVANVFAVPQ